MANRPGKAHSWGAPSDVEWLRGEDREVLLRHRGGRLRDAGPAERDERRRAGLCPVCGIVVTHKKFLIGSVKTPLTVPGRVYKGICLQCNSLVTAKSHLNERMTFSDLTINSPTHPAAGGVGIELKRVPTDRTDEVTEASSTIGLDFANVTLLNAGVATEREDVDESGRLVDRLPSESPVGMGQKILRSLDESSRTDATIPKLGPHSSGLHFDDFFRTESGGSAGSIFRTESGESAGSSVTRFDPRKYRNAEEAKKARRLRRAAC